MKRSPQPDVVGLLDRVSCHIVGVDVDLSLSATGRCPLRSPVQFARSQRATLATSSAVAVFCFRPINFRDVDGGLDGL